MAGHNKWSTIKHKKAKADAQKGKIFTKLAREIIVATKHGGGDPETNFRLRVAIDKARSNNMPNDNIKRAIQKGLGDADGDNYEEVIYEGYGPGGTAMMLDILTDNRNRTAGDIRHIFSKNGGNMGETGCVSWMFERKGYLTIESPELNEDDLMLLVLEAGSEDMDYSDDFVEIYTSAENFEEVQAFLKKKGIEFKDSEVTMIPQNTVEVTNLEQAQKIMNLIDALENHDDVQNVYSNVDISDDIVNEL